MIADLRQFVVDQYCKPGRLEARPVWAYLLRRLRRYLKAHHDGIVRYSLGGMSLRIPFSHDLYVHRHALPDYGANLARLAHYLHATQPNFTMIDVGANVGDTIALVREGATFPVLAVEADPNFFALMQENLRDLSDIDLVNAALSDRDDDITGRLVVHGGTAHFESEGCERVPALSLSTLVRRHPAYAQAGLVKIDTDGFDVGIVQGALALLEVMKPVLFIEYDPATMARAGFDGPGLFPRLKAAGYDQVLVFDNRGDFLIALDVGEAARWQDLTAYFSGRNSLVYADLAIFPASKADLAQSFRRMEIWHASEQRHFSAR